MTGSLRLWLWTVVPKQTQPNPRLAHRAGHTIMTNPIFATSRWAVTLALSAVRTLQRPIVLVSTQVLFDIVTRSLERH